MRQREIRFALAAGLALGIGAVLPAQAVQEGDTTTIYVTGTLVDAPQCTVNNGGSINVSFGDDLITTHVDGVNYKKQIDYTLSCSSLSSTALTMTLKGTTASFNSSLLYTSKSGLGIRLYNGSSALIPGSAIKFTYGSSSQPVLYAVPVAQNAATLTTGSFTGTATMVIAYQ